MGKPESILTGIYDGIMNQGHVVANTADEWTDDFLGYFIDGFVPIQDVQFVTVWLRSVRGAVEPSAGRFIGEWLKDKHDSEMAKNSTGKLTWLELAKAILELPEDELTRPATVWMYSDTATYEGDHFVYGISPYDTSGPISNANHSSIDIG